MPSWSSFDATSIETVLPFWTSSESIALASIGRITLRLLLSSEVSLITAGVGKREDLVLTPSTFDDIFQFLRQAIEKSRSCLNLVLLSFSASVLVGTSVGRCCFFPFQLYGR